MIETDDALLDLLVEWEESNRVLTADELCRDRPGLLPLVSQAMVAVTEMDFLDRAEPESTTHAGFQVGGRYRLVEVIGVGGSGQIWRGVDERLKRAVAVKLTNTASHDEACRAAALDDHPHIVRVFDVLPHSGGTAIVSALVVGQNLSAYTRGVRLAPRDAARLAAEVAEAFAHAHRRGVLHRDIKPENILVGVEGHAFLTDFGAATAMEAGDAVAGTLAYTAPEVIRGLLADPRADVFSLGVVLYELLTGLHPFAGSTRSATRDKIIGHRPIPPHRLNPAVGTVLSSACMKCLLKNPDERYGSASDLVADLRRAAEPRGWAGWIVALFVILALMLWLGLR